MILWILAPPPLISKRCHAKETKATKVTSNPSFPSRDNRILSRPSTGFLPRKPQESDGKWHSQGADRRAGDCRRQDQTSFAFFAANLLEPELVATLNEIERDSWV
jgi:hypothetical protein